MRQLTFWPKLSLIQYHDGEKAFIVDGLQEDLTPLKDILFNPNIIKIVHSARQDLEIFYQLWGQIVQPIFDTQIAARFCDLGQEVSLSQLVKDVLSVEMEKTVQFSDWLKRPLSPEQLTYAEQDVAYLIPLYHYLKDHLHETQKFDAFLEAQAFLLNEETYQPQPHKAWMRVKGYKQLTHGQKAWLKVLAAWRESEAAKQNKIRRLIVPDEILIKVATWQPQRMEKLARIINKVPLHQVEELWVLISESNLISDTN